MAAPIPHTSGLRRALARGGLGLAVLAAATAVGAAPAGAAGGPRTGQYACYQGGLGLSTYYNGVTVVIEDHSHYTTRGAHFTGTYRYVPKGRKVVFVTGKLRGLKSRYETGHGGQAIYITFKQGTAENTAVCGRVH